MPPSAQTLQIKLEAGRSIFSLIGVLAPIFLIAVFAAFIHIAPYWRAESQTPPGWRFAWNVSVSPDQMTYRIWSRQSQKDGVLVSNTFTTEPNRPHLPVAFYYAIGQMSRLTGWSPELLYAYLGSVFAFGLTILLYIVVRHFMALSYQTWWVFSAILIGGGLGAYFIVLSDLGIVNNNYLLHRIIIDSFQGITPFENYRCNYAFLTLFDTHYLLIWLLTTGSVFSLYLALRHISWWRTALTAFLFTFTTLVNIYQGVTLIAVTAGILFLCWRKRLLDRPKVLTGSLCSLGAAACMAWQVLLYRFSGLHMPTWRPSSILVSILLISFPLAWGLIAWGGAEYWRRAGFDECFLLGWALGGTALILSGPFYPYADRGLITLQIPIYVVAGAIYFAKYKQVTPAAALLTILLLGATPAWALQHRWEATRFSPDKPYMFLSAEQQELVDLLKRRAGKDDALIVDKSKEPWETDDLWLGPEYPGKLYCGNFFLTVDYDRKRAEVTSFYKDPPEKQSAFLQERHIRFVYVDAKDDPSRFERGPGLVLLKANSTGSLFEYVASTGNASR
jgi:hypothetical protein